MAMVRKTKTGKFELTIRNRLLEKPYYDTFDTEAEATAFGAQLESILASGMVPVQLQATRDKRASPLFVEVVRAYTQLAPITPSDDALLTTMLDELAGVRFDEMTIAWAQGYIGKLKQRARPLTPGSIRKRIGVLARVVDWHLRRTLPADQVVQVANPFRLLPRGYSAYSKTDAEVLAKREIDAPADQQRDRRITVDEHERILRALSGEKREDRERPVSMADDLAAMKVLYQLIVDTGLRLREAYTLRTADVDLARRTLNVRGTNKRGGGQAKLRQVPLKSGLVAVLQAWCSGRVGMVFPWWSGDPAQLDEVTAYLSRRFATLFDYAKVPDCKEHDLRHEATCRWVELRDAGGRWVFSEVEICKIMGWTDPRMMLRYASLRGTDLADRLAAL